jgi:nucleotide-binding universal stress UspA family protein
MSSNFRILLAVDLQSGTHQLLQEAERYGRALSAIVDVVHVAEPDPDFVGYIKSDSFQRQTRDAKAQAFRAEHHNTQAISEQLQERGVCVGQTLMVQGPVLETILEHVSRLGANLLILGSHHHSALYRVWYGDIAVEAAKNAPCSVLVVPVERA